MQWRIQNFCKRVGGHMWKSSSSVTMGTKIRSGVLLIWFSKFLSVNRVVRAPWTTSNSATVMYTKYTCLHIALLKIHKPDYPGTWKYTNQTTQVHGKLTHHNIGLFTLSRHAFSTTKSRYMYSKSEDLLTIWNQNCPQCISRLFFNSWKQFSMTASYIGCFMLTCRIVH
jgi:hypothetical protein